MNWLDIVVLSAVGLRTWCGYRRGLILQVFELAGLIAGLALAVRYYYPLQLKMTDFIVLPLPVLAVAAFLLILVGVMIAARILGHICTHILKVPGLGLLNALSGALVGALVALLAIAFLLSILQLFSIPPVEAALSASIVAPYLEQCMPMILDLVEGYLPREMEGGLPKPGGPVPINGREL